MKQIKSFIALALVLTMATVSAQAQNYKNSRYYNSETGRLDYGRSSSSSYYTNDTYFGFRIGAAFTSVSSDNRNLNGASTQTGLNVGFVVGKSLTDRIPLYLEAGLSYVGKGGKSKNGQSDKFTYDLNYIELPFVFKYIYSIDDDFTIQPFLGGYFALGVGGKIKNYGYMDSETQTYIDRTAYSSFGSDADQFKRFDGGLRFGCGVGYDMFYAELAYDLGLSNIGHDDFDDASNSALYLTVGVNF